MFRMLASHRASQYIQMVVEVLSVVLCLAWFAMIGFILLQGALEVAGALILFTLLIAGLAYANE